VPEVASDRAATDTILLRGQGSNLTSPWRRLDGHLSDLAERGAANLAIRPCSAIAAEPTRSIDKQHGALHGASGWFGFVVAKVTDRFQILPFQGYGTRALPACWPQHPPDPRSIQDSGSRRRGGTRADRRNDATALS